jgi:hypothetical protein
VKGRGCHESNTTEKGGEAEVKKAVLIFLTVSVLSIAYLGVSPIEAVATGSVIRSAQSGNWSDPNTWQGGVVPEMGDDVTILSPHNVTFDVLFAQLQSFTVDPGGTLTGSSDVNITTTGSVTVEGDILCLNGSSGSNGSVGISVIIKSLGTITVSGRIVAGSGGNGSNNTVVETNGANAIATGGNGGNGGFINLISINSNITILDSAELTSGNGGFGGNTNAIGGNSTFAGVDGGDATAISGKGGNGGNLTLSAPYGNVSIPVAVGILTVGNGGAGGSAYAVGGKGGESDISNPNGVGGAANATGGNGGSSGWLNLTPSPPCNVTLFADGGIGGMGGVAISQAGAKGIHHSPGCGVPGRNGRPGGSRGGNGGSGTFWGSDGAPATATGAAGGDGDPGGSGGFARAIGGNGGDSNVIAGDGGKATATGGNGGNGISCCKPGANGGNGGDAEAFGGNGGVGGDFGGDGGDAAATGGNGGNAGTLGTPPGVGGGGGGNIQVGGNGGWGWIISGGAGGAAGAPGIPGKPGKPHPDNATDGGVWFLVDKLDLLFPYISASFTILVATAAIAVNVKRIKRRREK